VQKTALEEFWPTVELGDPDLQAKLGEWQHFYKGLRPHDILGGLTPIDRLCELLPDAPLGDQITAAFNRESEFVRPRDWPSRYPRI
jgi:hypothetical protein